jgi:hypothetical protein
MGASFAVPVAVMDEFAISATVVTPIAKTLLKPIKLSYRIRKYHDSLWH